MSRTYVSGQAVELVGEEERVDLMWEDDEARRRRELWERERPQQAALRNARREMMRPGERLDLVLRMMVKLQGGNIRQVQRGAHSAEEPLGPPNADSLDVSAHLRVVLQRIRAIEAEVDSYLGVSPAPVVVLMRSDQKDSLICSARFRGMSPEDVHDAMPELGSSRTIQRVRSRNGLRGSNGDPKPTK